MAAAGRTGSGDGIISKNLLGLKFMQRGKAAGVVQADAQSGSGAQAMEDDSRWVLKGAAKKGAPRIVVDASFQAFEDLEPFGRTSFQSFNPEVDKIREDAKARPAKAAKAAEKPAYTASVSDAEMTERYRNFVKTDLTGSGKKHSEHKRKESEDADEGGAKKTHKKHKKEKRQ